ncbi:MAG TPA: hypothetical protein PKC72_11855 [Chitinophagaceae bacterium]|nr:hypothetical protein [Chitinophagaceae bacterium]
MRLAVFCLLVTFFSSYVNAQSYEDDYSENKDEDPKDEYFLQKRPWIRPLEDERRIPDNKKGQLKKNKAFWYADYEFEKEEDLPLDTSSNSYVPLIHRTWFQTLIWLVIIGGFAAAVMWFLAGSQVNIFRKKESGTGRGGVDNTMPEDIFSIQYQREIDKAIKEGNYRLAVRLMFLELLKKMNERNIIQFKQDKTNFDYLMQLHSTGYYKQFFRVVRNYEYSWYGEFDVNREAFDIVREDFKQLERQLG